ncbi:MAG TPA: hypothetical protein VMU18_02385 [Rhodoblastus sp.]|nr:hypothetical protein [Rhodoblastus sp.]
MTALRADSARGPTSAEAQNRLSTYGPTRWSRRKKVWRRRSSTILGGRSLI